jgi:SET domain-containing protein
MILVKTKLDKSRVHGIGCFAVDFIAKGTPVWKFVRNFDRDFPNNFPETLGLAAREQFLNYTYISRTTGNYILCSDDTRFFNHSDTPNVINIPAEGEQEGVDIAVCDIQAGDEILYDYRTFSDSIPKNWHSLSN